MPYRLRPSVHFGQVAEGVQFQVWGDAFVLRGPASLYPLCARLVALLERGTTREHVASLVPPNARPVALYVIDELLKRRAVLDTDRLTMGDLDPQTKTAFGDTIGYLESVSDDPYAAFDAFRRARVLAIGSGQSHFTLVRALVTMGLGSIECSSCHDQVHAERLRTYLGERRSVDGRVRQHGAFEPSARRDRWDLVVYVSDALSRAELAEADGHLLSDAAAVIAGVATGPRGIIGPLRHNREGAGLRDAIARAATRGSADLDGRAAPSPVLATVVGNVAAFECFKWLTGQPSDTAQGRAAVVSGESLACSFHPVDCVRPDPAPATASELAERLRGFRSVVEPIARPDLMQRLTPLQDPTFGLIDEPHPGGLPQTPLSLSATRLAARHAREESLIGIGRDEADARYDAIVEGLKAAARHGTPSGPVSLVTLDGRATGAREPAHLDMAAGPSYARWLSDGLQRSLARLIVADARPLEVTRIAVSFETCGDRVAKGWWKSLALRFATDIQVLHLRSASFRKLHVATVADAGVIGIGCGTAADEAIGAALQRALARVQLLRAGESADGVPLVGISQPADEAAVLSLVDDWLQSLRDLQRCVGVHPSASEPGVRQRGLLLGWIGIDVDA